MAVPVFGVAAFLPGDVELEGPEATEPPALPGAPTGAAFFVAAVAVADPLGEVSLDTDPVAEGRAGVAALFARQQPDRVAIMTMQNTANATARTSRAERTESSCNQRVRAGIQ
jgi:hypothetical protein